MRRICAARWFFVSLSHLIFFTATPAFAGPDPATTNGNTIYFQGNQSQGINYSVTTNGPSVLSADSLSTAIAPASGTAGIQMTGQDTNRNLTVNFDGSQMISTVNAEIFVASAATRASVRAAVSEEVVAAAAAFTTPT